MKPVTCMFVKNSFEHDARVEREARALVDAGWDVTVVAMFVPGVTPRQEERDDGIRVIRVSKPGALVWTLNRVLVSAAVQREQHAAAQEDREPDFDAARNEARIELDTTATPGAERTDTAVPSGRAIRLTAVVVRWLLNTVGQVLLPLLRPLRDRVLDARMGAVGRSVQAQVFHAHDLNTLAIAVRCGRAEGSAIVYDSHELHTGLARSTRWSRWQAKRREGRLIQSADVVLTVSDGVARTISRVHGIATPTVVRNVPDTVRLDSEPVDLRSTLGIPVEHLVLVYGGTVQRDRGIEATIEALDDVGSCSLVVVGHGGLRSELEERVRVKGSPVHFVGPFEHREFMRWLAGADIGTCCIIGTAASYRFSLPNKLFEYWSLGMPVVASNLPDIERVVRSEQAGAICDPTDPRSVARAIEQVRDHLPQMRARATDAGSRHHWGVEAAVLVGLYQGLQRRLIPASADDQPIRVRSDQ
ncbi:glycosyltransferase [Actinospongicola halichondriae]|uniref:glycosyltransferase n=1 Tax=Actinospongicola halichondriae TaxID=3236844 RepID=UPI003D53113C